jgi:alanine racemase
VPIFIYEDAVALSKEAAAQGKTANFHFVVDTGMSRIGFQATEESAAVCADVCKLPNLRAEGLFSHYATADGADLTSANEQLVLFEEFTEMLKARGIQIPIRHLNNSAGIINFPGKQDMVRSGIVQYGMYPSNEVDPTLLPVKPVMEWIAKVVYVKTLPAGRQISYGGSYTTTRDTVVATLPVGYADGYRRSLTDKAHVLIRGKKAPIIGRICMDQMMVDVTDIPGVQIGDNAVLIGRSGDEQITVDYLAELTGTLNYEIICGISRRTPRVYFRGGKPVSEVHYLLDAQEK